MRAFVYMLIAAACVLHVRAAEQIIDVGMPEAREHLGYGWGGDERGRGGRFAWIKELEGDVRFDLDAVADTEITIRAVPYYVADRKQIVALYINNRFVKEWICTHTRQWNYDPYTIKVPAEMLQQGRNQMTLRMGYRARGNKRYHALAVESILIRSNAPDEKKDN
ncbi:MAG: hypothetical protein AB7T27_00800 [Kiritimatiellia bacterium]